MRPSPRRGAELDVIDTQKQQARAALDEAIAERDLARLNLGYTELRAPIDGVVGNRSARAGAYAMVGAQLISLVPAHGLWVDANFKESQLADIRPDLHLLHPIHRFALADDGGPGVFRTGHVELRADHA